MSPYSSVVRPQAGAASLLDAARRKGWLTPERATALTTVGVPLVVVAVLVWLVTSILRGGSAAAPSAYAEFVDPSTGSYADVQLDRAMTSYGAFSAVVAGQGRVWPEDRVDVQGDPAGEVQLRYDGPAFLDPRVQPGARYEPADPSTRPDPVHLRLLGSVDAARHMAAVDVWVDGARHHIGSSAQSGGAEGAVEDFLGAVRAGDWDTVYSLETASMRNGSKRGDVVTGLANAGAVTTVSAAHTTGPTTFTVRAGVSYGRTPVRLTYGSGPASTRVEATVVVVVEGGAWRVLSVE